MTKRGNEAGEALKRLQQQHEQAGSSAQAQNIDLGAGDAAQQQSLLGVTPPIIGHGTNTQQTASGSRSVQQFFVAVSGPQGQNVAVQNPQLGPRQQLLGSPLVVVPPNVQRSSQLTPLVLTQDVNNDFQIIGSTTQVPHQILTPVSSSTSVVSRAGSTSRGTVHHLGQSQVAVTPVLTTPRTTPTPIGALRPQAPSESQIRGLITQLQAQSSQMVQLQQAARQASVTPPPQSQPTTVTQSPDRPRKKMKTEDVPAASDEVAKTRGYICTEKLRQMSHIRECYTEHLTELFFLQNGGNMMDYLAWKKKATPQLQLFLQSGKLDSDDEEVESQEKSINNEVKILTASGSATPVATPVAISTTLPPAVQSIQLQQTGGIPLNTTVATTTVGSPPPYTSPNTSSPPTTVNITTASSATVMTTTVSTAMSSSISSTLARMMAEGKSVTTPLCVSTSTVSTVSSVLSPTVKSQLTPGSQATKPHSISAVYDSAIGSQEAIVERAKQEAQVMQRVAELRKSGLWSARRLPKVQEPTRHKAHWDYLLEEMQWLAADFAQERKWKKAGARKIARMITRYHQEQQTKELKAEKEESQRLVRIAGNMAKMVKEFWSNIEKVVQYKQQSRLEEKRKKALDLHLSFIVDQTEKYSSWLTEGLGRSGPGSVVSMSVGSPRSSLAGDDGDFEPVKDESDDEETIEKAEEGLDEESTKKEIEELQAESEMPLEDLLKSLPQEVLDKPASLHESGGSEEESDGSKAKKRKRDNDDDSFHSDAEDSGDAEETINEEEKQEKEVDHKVEIDDLQKESEMSMEELYAKYAGAYDSDFEAELSQGSEDETDIDEDDDTEEEGTATEESSGEEEADGLEEVGVEALMEEVPPPLAGQPQLPAEKSKLAPNVEISDIAAAAESIQPTGYTLETTAVQTTVPFLLKHTLREYQHVGLDWLATMYVRKLNGILADEMGLGKTIQTIALLAHMACEHGVWGPHLIVVPTSVMLNWEMEFKKWCPAFKILTYYGSQKERKLKRTGWTKTNAFHVCITSYKLVIQDHQSFRRKKWKYFILDEAQNIKNFKSQRWQTLLNFISQRRLLLTGTPLQNSLMELWSLMHFLMPHVFQSHREFKEWFANPLSGMIEGSREYNENLIKRLHKVLRPFLLRRLKADVEKQMPKKYEHVVMCRLSKRQRYLYDDFMAQSKTKETLATGHFMSVINILMQLRKVCNHPNLFDPRPIISPFQMDGISYTTASIVLRALEKDPLEYIEPCSLYPNLAEMELKLPAYGAHRASQMSTSRKLIEEIDSTPDPPPRPKVADKPTKFVFRSLSPMQPASGRSSPFVPIQQRSASPLTTKSPLVSPVVTPTPRLSAGAVTSVTPSSLQGSLPAVSVMGSTAQVITTPVTATVPSVPITTSQTPTSILQAKVIPQPQASGVTLTSTPGTQPVLTSQPITVQIHHTQQGTRLMIPSGQLSQLPGFIQIVQTSTGQQIIATSQPPSSTSGQRVQTFINGPGLATAVSTMALSLQSPSVTPTVASSMVAGLDVKPTTTVHLPTSSMVASGGKPMVRVSPMASVSAVSTPGTGVQVVTSGILGQTVKTTTPSSTMTTAGPTQTVVATATKTMIASRTTTAKSEPKVDKAKEKAKSVFYVRELDERRKQRRKEKLSRLASVNASHCSASPVYGTDLTQLAETMTDLTHMPEKALAIACRGLGYVHCKAVHGHTASPNRPELYWKQTDGLTCIVRTPEQYLTHLKEMLERFVFLTPPVRAPRIRLHTGHPPPSVLQADRRLEYTLHSEMSPRAASLHPVSTRMEVQFPELRLIQYDCGKLQTMDTLLRQLKTGGHRVLVFTQMTRMLDILESFLNYHGHRYLRLDGTTKVEQRQALMDRFNMDKRIFVFILSTRSGGIGVNLTGADTVIFYDSDWNPTMDAQAQDRCHRIGQTRDVHIYRLVSEKTVEENILKKANQKRLLGNMAIEGGNFTTAFFKENTIKDLFEEPSGLDALAAEKIKQEEAEQSRQREARSKAMSEAAAASSAALVEAKAVKEEEEEEKLTQEQIEQALCAAEEESDIMAAKVVKAEQKAELAEFDENIPWDEREEHLKHERDAEISRVEHELLLLEKELTPVERMAVKFVEAQMAPFTSEELEKAEEEVTIAKEEWELGRLKSLKEEEERRAELEEDEMLFTYSRDDAFNQVKKKSKAKANKKGKARGESVASQSSPDEPNKRRSGRQPKRPSSVISDVSEGSLGSNEVGRSRQGNPAKANRTPKVESRYSQDEEWTPGGKKKVTGEGAKSPLTRSRVSSPEGAKSGLTSPQTVSPPEGKKPVANRKTGATIPKSNSKLKVKSPKKVSPKIRTSTPKARGGKVKKVIKVTPPRSPPANVPPPWSNPNLVIRTRRASAQHPAILTPFRTEDQVAGPSRTTPVSTAEHLATHPATHPATANTVFTSGPALDASGQRIPVLQQQFLLSSLPLPVQEANAAMTTVAAGQFTPMVNTSGLTRIKLAPGAIAKLQEQQMLAKKSSPKRTISSLTAPNGNTVRPQLKAAQAGAIRAQAGASVRAALQGVQLAQAKVQQLRVAPGGLQVARTKLQLPPGQTVAQLQERIAQANALAKAQGGIGSAVQQVRVIQASQLQQMGINTASLPLIHTPSGSVLVSQGGKVLQVPISQTSAGRAPVMSSNGTMLVPRATTTAGTPRPGVASPMTLPQADTNKTVPILEKFAMQLSNKTNLLQPGSPSRSVVAVQGAGGMGVSSLPQGQQLAGTSGQPRYAVVSMTTAQGQPRYVLATSSALGPRFTVVSSAAGSAQPRLSYANVTSVGRGVSGAGTPTSTASQLPGGAGRGRGAGRGTPRTVVYTTQAVQFIRTSSLIQSPNTLLTTDQGTGGMKIISIDQSQLAKLAQAQGSTNHSLIRPATPNHAIPGTRPHAPRPLGLNHTQGVQVVQSNHSVVLSTGQPAVVPSKTVNLPMGAVTGVIGGLPVNQVNSTEQSEPGQPQSIQPSQ